MKSILTLLILSLTIQIYSQVDTVLFLGINGKILESEDEALRKEEFEKIGIDNYVLRYYLKRDDNWKETGQQTITRINENTFKLSWLDRDKEDIIREIIDTNGYFLVIDRYTNNVVCQGGYSRLPFPLCKVSKWLTYYKSGIKKSEENYVNNQLTSNLRWDESGNEDISNVFMEADPMPKYGKGDFNDFRIKVQSKMRPPIYALENNIQGRVILEFVVMEDGRVENLRVVKGVHHILDKYSYKLINQMPSKWTPGYIDGIPVRIKFTLPLVYMIQ